MIKRTHFILAAIIAVFLLACLSVKAQVPAKTFGINAGFGSEWQEAGFLYTFSDNFEAGIGVSLVSKSYSVDEGDAPDSKTTVGFNVYGAYYLYKGDVVNPYLQFSAGYMQYPDEDHANYELSSNQIDFGISFGAQAFIVGGLAVWADVGISAAIESETMKPETGEEMTNGMTTISLVTTAVGASFYFNR